MCCVVGLIGRVVHANLFSQFPLILFYCTLSLLCYNISYHLRFVRYETEIGNQRFLFMLDLSSNRFIT